MYGWFTKMMNKKDKGFTLVELMVVVAIIGVLAAVAVPIYNTSTDKAQEGAIIANLATINGAIMSMQASENTPNGGWSATNITTEIPKYINGGLSQKPGTYSIVANTAGNSFIGQVVLAGEGGLTGTYYLNIGQLTTTMP